MSDIAEAVTQEAPAVESVSPATVEAPVTSNDPFALDESRFASLSPEQRAALDPVLTDWKKVASETLEKEKKSFEPHITKAQALDRLVQDPRFVKWYQEQQSGASVKPTEPEAQKAPIVSPEEWSNALQAMANGDATAWNALNQKQWQAWAQPKIEQFEKAQQENAMNNEMTRLFSSHADVKELDTIGRENDPTAPSLLELCLHRVKDQMGGTMEQAYQLAKSIASSMEGKSKRQAMGMVQAKKDSVTATPSTSTKEEGVIYVDSSDEALTQNIEAAMEGRKVKYAVRK